MATGLFVYVFGMHNCRFNQPADNLTTDDVAAHHLGPYGLTVCFSDHFYPHWIACVQRLQ